ncbi:MAG: LmeA family phospholipid-binding protein [Nitriliruptoraceae bacterium]
MIRRGIVITAVFLLVVAALIEVAAVPVTTRLVRARVDEAVVGELAVTGVRRPAVADVVTGRLRDVDVEVVDMDAGGLPLASVEARVDQLAFVGADPFHVDATVTVTSAGATAYLADRAPAGARPTATITADAIRISDERVPFELAMRVDADAGNVRLQPSTGDDRLWEALGLGLTFAVPACVTIDDVVLGDGEAIVAVAATLVIADDGSVGC